jgi:sulfur carrier protein
MTIVYNGSDRVVRDGATVAEVVAETTAMRGGLAVAVNGEVVRRADWDSTVVREADRLEVLTAVQGG